ncbi:rhomboid family intramembrane serine protease [candidate division KSB1 bacterium]|nr:rhomboid family intramembrane serine protease [candidate division KSB1 bacterium]
MGEPRRSGTMICPGCGRLISANASECIYCGRKNVRLWGAFSFFDKYFGTDFAFHDAVSIVCIILYVISVVFEQFNAASLFGPGDFALKELGATGSWAVANERYWTFITAMYLHGNILHIFFNLLWIRQIAPVVQDLFDTSRLIIIFTFSGVIGFILSSFFNYLTIGASGSIFGLLAALIYYGRSRGGTFGTDIYLQVGRWAILLFVFGLFFPRVDNYGHAGGFIGGLLCAYILGYKERSPEKLVHKIVALICVGLTIVAFVLTFLTIKNVH